MSNWGQGIYDTSLWFYYVEHWCEYSYFGYTDFSNILVHVYVVMKVLYNNNNNNNNR